MVNKTLWIDQIEFNKTQLRFNKWILLFAGAVFLFAMLHLISHLLFKFF